MQSEVKKDRLYIWGVVLVVTGYLLCLNPYWWIFGPPLVLLTGIILISVSKKKTVTKILFGVLPVILWFPGVWALFYFGSERMTPETFLIPKTFRGKIVLYYGESCGEIIPKENGRFIYNIPKNGVMIFKNKQEGGIIDEEFYFVDSTGKKISKINVLEQQDFNESYSIEKNKNEPSRKQVAVFLGGTGSVVLGSKGKPYRYTELYIEPWDSLRVYSDKKTDSVAAKLTNNCRLRSPNITTAN